MGSCDNSRAWENGALCAKASSSTKPGSAIFHSRSFYVAKLKFSKRAKAKNKFWRRGTSEIFMGDVAMLQGTSALATARVKSEEAEILEVPAAELRRALAELPDIGEPIMNALIMRRRRLRRDREFSGLRVIASHATREGHQLDDFLDKNHIPHRVIEFESEQGQALSSRLHLTSRDLPTLITASGAPLRRPSLREVAQVAGLLRPLAQEGETEITCDLAIVGGGPTGLAAAVYAASEGLQTIVWRVTRLAVRRVRLL